jgi:hypothetical protein
VIVLSNAAQNAVMFSRWNMLVLKKILMPMTTATAMMPMQTDTTTSRNLRLLPILFVLNTDRWDVLYWGWGA